MMQAVTSDRKARLEELLARRRFAAALLESLEHINDLGVALGRDDALAAEAVQAALDAVEKRKGFHGIWHRVWGVMLRSEAMETTNRLASRLEGERAVLLWREVPPVGFVVDVSLALRALSEHIGPEPGELGAVGPGYVVLLVADGGESGLRFGYEHYGSADQYELESWGRYALPLVE